MLTPEARAELEKQQYRIVGEHSAVKTCGWTKNMINGEGGCYKLKFYGIMSNQCMQMTTSISCANRCTFCWRGYKAPVSKDWKWGVDDPNLIFEKSLEAHEKLLVGFGGSHRANKRSFEASKTVKHVALSLTGEPIFYPRINELIDRFHAKGISTFLVTNAQYPEAIRDLKPITQLYVSIDAPNKPMLKEVDVPLFADNWERLNKSLEYLAQKKQRTCVRLTVIKGINDTDFQGYADLIHKGSSDFIEIKSYMFVGPSQQRLKKENMPLHEEIVTFTQELVKYLPDYEIVSEHIPSRVVMLAKKKYKKDGVWYTWINFPKFHELYAEYIATGKEFTSDEYNLKTPQTGLSGKGTVDHLEAMHAKHLKKRADAANATTQSDIVFVDESTDEMELDEKND
ncbi:4-demethylwyosine synthase TYW1 [Candidatus Woesearchaeota archaeon]|nr:4-demethylwyosine synthase TYW1 [Candidatus Woesearchaeota archaeon]